VKFAGSDEDFYATERPRPRKDLVTRFTGDLSVLAPVVRAELIFGIQQRDHDQIVFAPMVLRRLLVSFPNDLGSLLDLPDGFAAALTPSMAGLLRGVLGHIRRVHAPLQGIDPTAGDVWGSALVGLTAGPNRQYRAMSGTIDFRPIRQAWLRRIVQDYGRSIRPPAATLGRVVGSVSSSAARRPAIDVAVIAPPIKIPAVGKIAIGSIGITPLTMIAPNVGIRPIRIAAPVHHERGRRLPVIRRAEVPAATVTITIRKRRSTTVT
jgi:hypothetical protein